MMKEWPVVVNDDHIAKVKQLLAAGADVNRAPQIHNWSIGNVHAADDYSQWSALNLTFMWDDLENNPLQEPHLRESTSGNPVNPLQRLFLEADSSGATSQLKDLMEEFYGDGLYGVNVAYYCHSCEHPNSLDDNRLSRSDYEYILKKKEKDPECIRLKEAIMLLAEYGAAEALEMQGSREQRPVPEWARRAFALGADIHKVKTTLKA